MATYYLVQGGSSLYSVTSAGVPAALSLPSGVTLDSTRRLRTAVFANRVVCVNSPSVNLAVNINGAVAPLGVIPPQTPPALSNGPATIGAHSSIGSIRGAVTFVIADAFGRILAESPLGPLSPLASISANVLAQCRIPVSTQAGVNARRFYRTLSDATGAARVLFPAELILDNVTTTHFHSLLDADLSVLTAPTLGNPQGTLAGTRIELIVAWKNRLWWRGRDFPDRVYYSEDGSLYQHPADNFFAIGQAGEDLLGVSGFVPRRDELGFGKRDGFWKLVGDRPANWQVIKVHDTHGIMSQESVVVVDDIGFFLGEDGVYAWANNRIESVSKDQVHAWFATDTYFNRTRFVNAFAKWNQRHNLYELHLAAAGSSVEDRWVAYDIAKKRWYGPHKTAAMTPAAAFTAEDASDLPIPIVGGTDGYLYVGNRATRSDHASAIDMDVQTPFVPGAEDPDLEKVWLRPSIFTKGETTPGAMTVTPRVGGTDALEQVGFNVNLTKARVTARRLGFGELVALRFQEATAAQDVTIRGFEVPFVRVGRR